MGERNQRKSAPKMPFLEYLNLVQKIQRDKRFKLSNQELRNGIVYFRDPVSIKILNEAIHAYNTDTIPETEQALKKRAEAEWALASGGLTLDGTLALLEDVKGPDSSGTYTARCPVCAVNGGDSDSNHLRFNPDKGIYCFAGHNRFEIMKVIREID